MCYLRNFSPIKESTYTMDHFNNGPGPKTQKFNFAPEKFNVDFNFLENQPLQRNLDNSSGFLMNLLKLAQKNSQALVNLQTKIDQTDFLIQEMNGQSIMPTTSKASQQNEVDTEQSTSEQESSFKTQQYLTQKLFGKNKEYKYKLVLDGQFPEQVFKERNFSFNMKLVDLSGNTIRNSNIIHLCLGVCDVNGQWVTETKTKQTLMKGRTEAELYHGQAQYSKIFSRDVSRHYPAGKLNIAIYPKDSVLKYCHGTNSLEENVKSQEIEPMLIKDLTIKAKKKQ